MDDLEYPPIDIEAFAGIIKQSNKVESIITEGFTSAYILKGSKPINQRIVPIRNIGGEIDFIFATGTLGKLKDQTCWDLYLQWLEENKSWKDGGYFAATPEKLSA